jgi:uncharacterized DUF497 family protein
MDDNYNIIIGDIKFEWDISKSNSNFVKHGIGFDVAATAFFDPISEVYFDPDHSESEERFILIGCAVFSELLVVCHCYRGADEVVRIISARNATETEASYYGR